MRWLGNLLGITAFLLFFVVGYSYFYPYNSPLARHPWFELHVTPQLDAWLIQARQGTYSGHLVEAVGELKFKSDSDFVFYPARSGQRFFGKTMVASGPRASASIEVGEGVQVQLDANSILVIEPQIEGTDEGPTVRVIGGAAVAKANRKGAKKVRVISATGASRVVDQKGVAVVADGKGYLGDSTEDIQALRDLYALEQKQNLAREEALRAESLRVQRLVSEQKLAEAKRLEETKLQNFVFESTDTLSSARVSTSKEAEVVKLAVPQKIVRRKFDSKLVGSTKLAPSTKVAKGLFEAKQGNRAAATRSFASALASPLYRSNESFNPSVQMALDGMLESYELAERCALARDTVNNVLTQYRDSPSAQRWSKTWHERLRSGLCKGL